MKCDLIDYMGSDLTCVNSARVSFDKESEWGIVGYEEEVDAESRTLYQYPVKSLQKKDEKLIHYLAKHGHFTPFTHAQITLRETVPIFVARQRFKHTVGFSYNEVSRRYVDDGPEFYIPEVWRSRPGGSIKQGSGEAIEDGIVEYGQEKIHLPTDYEEYIRMCKDQYHFLLSTGVAPEQARMVLPQSMYTSYYVTGSLAAFARAYNLRADDHAQKEIQELASQWKAIIKPLFPVSWRALTYEET